MFVGDFLMQKAAKELILLTLLEILSPTHMTEQLAESGLIWNCHQPLVKYSVRVGREHGSMHSQPIHTQTLGTVHTGCRLQSSLFNECVCVWVYAGYMPKLDPTVI